MKEQLPDDPDGFICFLLKKEAGAGCISGLICFLKALLQAVLKLFCNVLFVLIFFY